jgi:GDP/UDP-N,N'-diacetylbacillosamine 2-epimerase (hydrolysing)
MLARVPIVHLHGGELTLGAVDDVIRHAITKMSYLHFTSTEAYRRRVIQLGEDPSRVWTVGAMGVDNALNLPRLTRAQLEADLGEVFGARTAVVTYHPVTLERATAETNMRDLLSALDGLDDLSVVFTLPNADPGNVAIFEATEAYVLAHPERASRFASLGAQRYLSLAEEADVVVGNSSSGVIEAPSLGTPSVDIGDRQHGRVRAPSVLHASPDADSISTAIRHALSPEFQRVAARRENPNGDGHAAERIAAILREQAPLLGEVKKPFRDIPFNPAENPGASDPADKGEA